MASLNDYKKFWERQLERDEKDKQSLLKFLRGSAEKAAKVLAEQFGAKKIYLFGSTVEGRFFHKRSDVDLAIEGIPPQKYFSALAKISDIFKGKSRVDLLPLEDASPKVKERIEKEGELLYG